MDSHDYPLIVDLDGTLSRVDSLPEAMLHLAFRRPTELPAMVRHLMQGPLSLKTFLFEADCYAVEDAPLREDLLEYLTAQHAAGRQIHLYTAAHQSVADAVAARVGLFATAVGSSNGVNLRGAAKLAAIQTAFPDGFVYAGNDMTDVSIWREAGGVIVAGSEAGVEAAVQALGKPVEGRFPDAALGLRDWLRALRVHQWSKNALLFVPLFLAHRYLDPMAVLRLLTGFISVGMVASATYLINDLSDLAADRAHHSKRFRALASGRIQARDAVLVGGCIGLAGLVAGFVMDALFGALLLVYVVFTLAYSLRLKAIALVDVFVLGLLFTLRIIMGIVLLRVTASPWLIVFSVFFFFSLSMAKRHVEIVRAADRGDTGRIKGRGYLVQDAPLTLALGVSTSLAAVTLLFLYVVNDAYPHAFYRQPIWLLGIAFLVFLWTSRIWLKSHRGLLDDDPIAFALRDPPSWAVAAAVVVTFILAIV